VSLKVSVKVLPHGAGLPLPRYMTPGSAGMDLFAAVSGEMTLAPGQTAPIPTGISIALPGGFEGQVRPRSGLGLRHGVGLINAPGTIDSDYRGEVMVLMTNFSGADYRVQRGDRIAQLVVARYERVEWEPCDELPPSGRSGGGFGHSGR